MNQKSNQFDSIESRPELKEVTNGVIEMAESEFSAPIGPEKLGRVITQLDFGEVVLKVVKGKIQTMSITKHYKIDKVELNEMEELTN